MFLNSFQVHGNFEATGSTAHTITTQTMTVDDLSSSYTPEQSLAVITQRDATGRRCHKTVKGGGEAVWPPKLEAALITGLQLYSERYRARMKHRGRFIGRNHFLADYVKGSTGRHRTAKQVGSRLQQLKDTCRQLDILYLITGRRSFARRRDHRREFRRSRKPKASPPRSVSSTPELSDEFIEKTPEPQQYDQGQISPQYHPTLEDPQPITYCITPIVPASPSYASPTECSFANTPCVVPQYCAPTPSHYVQPQVQEQWSNPAQFYPPSYSMPSPEWTSHCYAPAMPQPQQQYTYYGAQFQELRYPSD